MKVPKGKYITKYLDRIPLSREQADALLNPDPCNCRGNMNINNPKEPLCPSCKGRNPSYDPNYK